MAQPIRTKLHKLLQLIDDDEVYFTAPAKLKLPLADDDRGQWEREGKAPHFSDYGVSPKQMRSFIEYAQQAVPKFVFDTELIGDLHV